MVIVHPSAPRRVAAFGRHLIGLRPEIEAATGLRLVAAAAPAEGLVLRPERRGLRAAARRLGRPCLLVAPGPLDAPCTDPGQPPTSLVLLWDDIPPAASAADPARAAAALALLRGLGLPLAADIGEGPEAAARVARRYLDAPTYFDAWRRHPIAFEEAARQAAWLRDRIAANGRGFVLVGVSRWKRRSVASLLASPAGPAPAARSAPAAVAAATRSGGGVAAWATRMPAALPGLCARAGVPLWRLEDGFVRSVGLGASFRPGASVALDSRGIYFDPARDSDLTCILRDTPFPPALLARAGRLRALLARHDVTKYNVGLGAEGLDLPPGRRIVLVCGQVEDDASLRAGAGRVRTNLALLRAARERAPGAFLLFKAHPDVEAGFRPGAVPPEDVSRLADRVVDGLSMAALLRRVDHVETMTSLTGFEALLRGVTVTCHGRPFYAGWGLTEQAGEPFARGRTLSLDALVAGTLILYPRYLDPVTLRPCEPELLVERLAEARAAGAPSRLALSAARHRALLWRHALLGPLGRLAWARKREPALPDPEERQTIGGGPTNVGLARRLRRERP